VELKYIGLELDDWIMDGVELSKILLVWWCSFKEILKV
jgi:hypothetical protein